MARVLKAAPAISVPDRRGRSVQGGGARAFAAAYLQAMTVRVLICGFGAFPAAPRNPSEATIAALAAEGWAPPGAEVAYLPLPVAWRASAEVVLDRIAAEPVDAVLVVGVAVGADAFRVETQARNIGAERLDHAGETWTQPVILADWAKTLPVTAPAAMMLQALHAQGLPARLSDDAGDYLCNFTLFRLLAASAAPSIGFLHVPQVSECAGGAVFSLGDVRRGVCACATMMAAPQRLRVT